MADMATNYVTLARHLASSNGPRPWLRDLGLALSMYSCAFSMQPHWQKELKIEYRVLLSRIAEGLDRFTRLAVVLRFIVLPDNLDLHIDVGTYLYKYGYMAEALKHFEKVMDIDRGYVSVERNMNSAKAFLFPTFRFRMVNDSIRNAAYREAIRRSVTAVDSVLDIETGTGLLALYANERNPVAIATCHYSNEMARLAECVMQDNQAQDVVVLHGSVLAVKCSDTYFKRSVLLTDLFDSGLFGENILQALHHAWANLLQNNSKIIPGKAEYFIAGVKCNELCDKYKLRTEIRNILNVPQMNVHPFTVNGATYCDVDLDMFKNLKYVCEPKLLFTIDFNNFEDVHEKLNGQKHYNADLIAAEDGEINAVIGWFNLHLTDDIILSSNPKSSNKAPGYQQALFFDFVPMEVRENDTITVPFLTHGGQLNTIQNMSTTITRVSLETITYLNDTDLISMVTETIGSACMYLGQTILMEEVDVIDLSPFPVFGVHMMKRGVNSLICVAKTLEDEAFLKTVLVANGIPKSKVTILVTEYWSLDFFADKKFHVIYGQIIDMNGEINWSRRWLVEHLKHSHLIPGGLCLPSSVTMMCQLISSKYLEMNNRVRNEEVGYQMANHVNRYQVSQVLYIDIATLEYEALSQIFDVSTCEEPVQNVVKVPIVQDGDCTAILCWYRVQMIPNCHEIYTNRANSFVQSMAYMMNPISVKLFRGDEVNIYRCVDRTDQSFKLMLNNDRN